MSMQVSYKYTLFKQTIHTLFNIHNTRSTVNSIRYAFVTVTYCSGASKVYFEDTTPDKCTHIFQHLYSLYVYYMNLSGEHLKLFVRIV